MFGKNKGYAEKLGLIDTGIFSDNELNSEKARRVAHIEKKKRKRLLNKYQKRRDRLYQEAKDCYKEDDTEAMQKKLIGVKRLDAKIEATEEKVSSLQTIEEKAEEEVLQEDAGDGAEIKALGEYIGTLANEIKERTIDGESEVEELKRAEYTILDTHGDVSDIRMDRESYDSADVNGYIDQIRAETESEMEEVEETQNTLEDALENAQT